MELDDFYFLHRNVMYYGCFIEVFIKISSLRRQSKQIQRCLYNLNRLGILGSV